MGTLTQPPVPEGYRQEAPEAEPSWSPARAALGKRLFYDRLLSRDRSVACSDCHRPDLAFTDGRATAAGIGGRAGRRNTPTVINRGLGRIHFWDGRAASLEEQALGPIANPGEMDLPVSQAVVRLARDARYAAEFRRAFGGGPTPARLAAALASYQRSIYSVDAPFDRFLAGEASALSASAQRGMKLFGAKARCAECHTGPSFTDELFHTLGLPPHDTGRGGVTGTPHEKGAFKTPTLREVARTAPYMHDGSMATLEEVVEYYDKGGEPVANLDPKMKPLSLTAEEKADLVEFLRALSGRVVELTASAEEDVR
jgi:cytochrome c peroxidase